MDKKLSRTVSIPGEPLIPDSYIIHTLALHAVILYYTTIFVVFFFKNKVVNLK